MVVVGGGSVPVQRRLTCSATDCAGACTDDGCDAAAAATAPSSSTAMPFCSPSDAARSNASRDAPAMEQAGGALMPLKEFAKREAEKTS